jgi:hypothetical protein
MMTTTDEYIYAEPAEITQTVYLDISGHPHLTRESAIAANIASDIKKHLREQLSRVWPDDAEKRAVAASAIVSQLRSPRNRQLRSMVRDLIEATD